MRQGSLAGRYPAVAAMVMFALIPYLALSSSLGPLTPIIAKQLHMSLQTMSLAPGLGNAAYAVGTVIAVQFAQHLPQRRMLVVYAALLVVGSVLTAAAQDAGMYIVGPRGPGPVHQPAADRRRTAPGDHVPGEQAPRYGGDHEHVHLRGRCARPVHRRPASGGDMLGDRCSGSSPRSRQRRSYCQC